MFATIENWLTLGGRYTAAAVVYLGIALILGGSTLLDSPQVLARLAANDEECSYTVQEWQENRWVDVTYNGCPVGQWCCGTECISDNDGEASCCTDDSGTSTVVR